jgi:hypothetical protein
MILDLFWETEKTNFRRIQIYLDFLERIPNTYQRKI